MAAFVNFIKNPFDPPRQQAPQITVHSPVDINNSDTNAPVIAPVINLPEIKFNPNFTSNVTSNVNVDAVDEDFNNTQKTILKFLMTGLASGSAAVILGESPIYFGSMGVIIAGGKKYTLSAVEGYETIAALCGGTVVSAVMGKDLLSSALILSTGSLVGDLII